MGIYIFTLDALDRALAEDAGDPVSVHDFGKSIIPMILANDQNLFAFPYSGYWVDVGTIDSYWQAHMDLLESPPALNLNDRSWVIHTRSQERPPVLIHSGATIGDSLITDGSIIAEDARVDRSVLSPGVYVGPGAVVRESVILNNSYIEAGAQVYRTVVDKNATIGHDAVVGEDTDASALTMVGKNSKIPTRYTIGGGSVIHSDVVKADFPSSQIPSGAHVRRGYQTRLNDHISPREWCALPSHILARTLRHWRSRARSRRMDFVSARRATTTLANLAARPDRVCRFSVPMLLRLRRQSLSRQPGPTHGRWPHHPRRIGNGAKLSRAPS